MTGQAYYDSAPHSFGFRQVYPDGRTGIVGGLLYHGKHDQSFAVLDVYKRQGCRGNREEFVRLLGSKGIDVVFRENDAGPVSYTHLFQYPVNASFQLSISGCLHYQNLPLFRPS